MTVATESPAGICCLQPTSGWPDRRKPRARSDAGSRNRETDCAASTLCGRCHRNVRLWQRLVGAGVVPPRWLAGARAHPHTALPPSSWQCICELSVDQASSAGAHSVNALPSPFLLDTVRLPPIVSTMAATIARPSPKPLGLCLPGYSS